MSDKAKGLAALSRSAAAVVIGALWLGVGIGVGWAVGFLADRLVLPQHHDLILGTLALCAVVLVAWAYGTRLLYLEVRAGVDEATSLSSSRRRTGYRYVAIVAAPIIGVLIGLSTSGISVHGGGGAQRAVPAADAPIRGVGSSNKTAEDTNRTTRATTYTVRPGDRLTSLADHFYGSAADWPVIAKANAGRLHEQSGARLVDPTLLPVGMALEIPSESTITTTPPPPSTDRHDSGARQTEVFAVLAGFGLIGTALFARRQIRRRAYQLMRTPATGRPPRLAEPDAEIEALLRPLVVAELPEWIDAANRLLCAGLCGDRSLLPPRVSVVRAGPLGVELLLEEPCGRAPEGFVVLDGGRTWRLDPRLELPEVRASAGETQPFLAGLIPIAEDESGSYLVACGPGESLSVRGSTSEIARGLGAITAHLANAPWGEVTFYRVGPSTFVGGDDLQEIDVELVAGLDEALGRDPLWRAGLPENQPILLVESPELADEVHRAAPSIVSVIGPMADADRLVFFEEGTVTIEPLGLSLPALLPSPAELEAVARLRAAASTVPPAAGNRSALPSPDTELPVAGAVEVRILRGAPDLVGDVDPNEVKVNVVQLVAFLVLHGRRADTSTLRDVFGIYRRDKSLQQKTVWNAASQARKALGMKRFPLANGNQPYTLSNEVSCDWLRFKEMVAIARSLELGGEATRAIDALTIALGLIGEGVPGSYDSVVGRYIWLDAEQFLVDMEVTIVQAAHSLAMLSIEHHPYPASLDDAAWAIAQGRIIAPDARPLREAAMFLADAREDDAGIAAEFEAAVDAVDALGIGEDVDPVVETLFQAMTRARSSSPPADAALA